MIKHLQIKELTQPSDDRLGKDSGPPHNRALADLSLPAFRMLSAAVTTCAGNAGMYDPK